MNGGSKVENLGLTLLAAAVIALLFLLVHLGHTAEERYRDNTPTNPVLHAAGSAT